MVTIKTLNTLIGGDDDPNGIKIYEHYDILSIKLWFNF